MKYQVLGLERRTGEFVPRDGGNAIAYDNYILHCVRNDRRVYGQAVEQVKVKVSDIGEMIAAVGGKAEQMVDHVFDFEMNRYGKILNWELLK